MALKVAIGGPPHSGKTVLIGLLRGLLPRNKFVVVEAAPDGEGITGWAHNADLALVRAIRRKGTFLPEFVDWVCSSVQNSTADITIVDVGGRRTPENERIFKGCSHFVVVSSDPEETARWAEFGSRLGLQPLAILDSSLEGEDKIFSEDFPFLARITRLERECPPIGSEVVSLLAQRILEIAGKRSQVDGSEWADVNFPALAKELDLPIRNNGPDRDWSPNVLPKLLGLVSTRCMGRPEVKLWGNCPAGFPYHCLACGLQARVRYYDPKISGYVPLPEVQPQGEGQLLEWRIKERDSYSFVEFVIPRQIFDVFDLSLVVPPAVPIGKGVVLSGKGPWWLTGTICRSYYHAANVKWVAVFTPQESSRSVGGRKWSEFHPGEGPAVVVASRDEQVQVGMVIPFQLKG